MKFNKVSIAIALSVLSCSQLYAEHLSREQWELSASSNTGQLNNAIDGDISSRWSTGTAQNSGQYLQVDLGANINIDNIELDTSNSVNDYPRSYSIYTSVDGSDWGNAVATGSDGSAVTSIDFDPLRARYVKIEQTGADSYYWWSIHDLNINESETNIELNNANWSLSSSTNTDDVENAIDGDDNSRWTTQARQADGQDFIIDLSKVESFDRIVLNSNENPNDYPRAYDVMVSDDNRNWKLITSDIGTGSKTVIDFVDQQARYIKIEQTGTSDSYWWSIHDLSIFADSNDSPDVQVDETENESNCGGVYDLPTCMTEMSEAGGGTIILAEQTYKLTDTLILLDNVNIEGQGYDSVIEWDDSISKTIDAPLLYSSAVNNISMKNFKLRCDIDQDADSNDLRNDNVGFFLYGGGDPTSEDEADHETSNNNIYLESIEVMYCSHGIHIKGASDVTVVDLKLHDNGNTEVDYFHNIYFRRVGNLVVKQTEEGSGGYYASPRGHGFRASHISNAYLDNLNIYDNADHGVHVDNIHNMRMHNLNVHDNCSNSSGACAAIKCYGDQCDIDYDAAAE